MLSRGTERLTREQLAAAFEKLQTTWDVSGGAQGVVLRLETTRANLDASLALAAEVLQTPRFDAGRVRAAAQRHRQRTSRRRAPSRRRC